MAKRTIRIVMELELSELEGEELKEAQEGTFMDCDSDAFDEELVEDLADAGSELEDEPRNVADQIVGAIQEDPEIWAGSGMFLKVGLTKLVGAEWVGDKT